MTRLYSILSFSIISLQLFADQSCNQEVFGRSFMFTHPANQNISMRQHLWHDVIFDALQPAHNAMQLFSYYLHSLDQSKIARYFLINGKNCLLISGDENTSQLFTRDIRAEWLQLPANFSGNLSLQPKQRQFGFTLMYWYALPMLFDNPWFSNYWLTIELPVILVENNLNLCQSNVKNPGKKNPQNIIQAFAQPAWCFSRVGGNISRLRPAELKLSCGRTFGTQECDQFAVWTTFVVPLGNKQDARILFDPVVGNNQHVGFGAGIAMQFYLNPNPEQLMWSFFVDLEGIYLFPNTQLRTFDLRKKPWSRFLLYVNKNSPPESCIPGVNLLTRKAKVLPYGMADFAMGWRVQTDFFDWEIAYNIWGHANEKVELQDPLNAPCNVTCFGEFGIAGSGTIEVDGQTVAASASASTIQEQAPDDTSFVIVKDGDIDLCSAAAESALNHRVHFALGWHHHGCTSDAFFGSAFFIEAPQKNSALGYWGVWFKIGGSF